MLSGYFLPITYKTRFNRRYDSYLRCFEKQASRVRSWNSDGTKNGKMSCRDLGLNLYKMMSSYFIVNCKKLLYCTSINEYEGLSDDRPD